jgi:DNA-binding SARP family transcriptional activator
VISRFRTQKAGALLAYLAYHPDREHPRDVLIELLWPEDDRDASRHKLNVALSSLRAQLEPPGVPDGSVLLSHRLSVGLSTSLVTTDVREFTAALAAADTAGDPQAKVSALTRAVELYAGRLLTGYYEDWILSEEERLQERYFRALLQLLSLLEMAGRLDEALQLALLATGLDPLREETHRAVMRLFLAKGCPEAAHRQYRTLEAVLAEGLGSRPSAATRELLVRGGAPAAACTRNVEPPSPPAVPAIRGVQPDRHAANAAPPLETVGGAMPLESRFYITRPADEQLQAALRRWDSIVLVKGASQAGKTSLLARGLRQARNEGARVIRTDFRILNGERLTSADALLRTLAETIGSQLGLEPGTAAWRDFGGPNLAFSRYLREEVLARIEEPVVWGMDGVDRLFTVPFGSEIFELLRSWHNERAFDPDGPWSRLTLVIAYATEARLFITDPNRSPFNVGTRLELEDFTLEQVRDLNERYGAPLRDAAEVARFYDLLSGHPYLVRHALHEMAVSGTGLGRFEACAARDEWVLGDHLRRVRALLARDPELQEAVGRVLQGDPCPSADAFYRLRSAGVLAGEAVELARVRCKIYASYLCRHLPQVASS